MTAKVDQRYGFDNFYVTSPLSDNTDGFISAQIWANLFTTGLNSTAEEFINELNLELPKRALSYASAFMFPAPPDAFAIRDQQTNRYPLLVVVMQLTLFTMIAISSLVIAVLALMVRSQEVEFGMTQGPGDSFWTTAEAQPPVTMVELARKHLTEPLIPAINSVSQVDKSRGVTSVQSFLDPLRHYANEETFSSVRVAPNLRARNRFGIWNVS